MALVASYSESNRDGNSNIANADLTWKGVAQTFKPSSSVNLTSVKFYLACSALTPSGNVFAELYAHSGSYGSTGVGTGSALATSDAFDSSTLTESFVLKELTFSGGNQYAMVQDTPYVILIKYTSGGDATHYVAVGTDSTTLGHAGNNVLWYDGSWEAHSNIDTCFYVYGSVTGPTLDSITPNSGARGATNLVLTLAGSGFNT